VFRRRWVSAADRLGRHPLETRHGRRKRDLPPLFVQAVRRNAAAHGVAGSAARRFEPPARASAASARPLRLRSTQPARLASAPPSTSRCAAATRSPSLLHCRCFAAHSHSPWRLGRVFGLSRRTTMNSQNLAPAQTGTITVMTSTGVTHLVTFTDAGKWLHAPGSDFLFAYIDSTWPQSVQADVTNTFETALSLSQTIKDSVKKTAGQDVVNGLYLLNQPAMTEAMNAIDGMGQTAVATHSEQGSGTAVTINGEFFTAILGGLGGDVAPLMDFLTTQMGDLQVQTRQSKVTQNFGTVIGLISLMPVLNVPITSFQYVYSSAQTSQWFVQVMCVSTDHYDYDYNYTVVNYNYVKPSAQA
jgi:hypothetical protein